MANLPMQRKGFWQTNTLAKIVLYSRGFWKFSNYLASKYLKQRFRFCDLMPDPPRFGYRQLALL
ncbi:MAG TPA: hypothetical protein PLV65_02535, partial [Tenuifilaceae bacterium]|nr:hypothetical protein [Tenuifilaceae bacterium]